MNPEINPPTPPATGKKLRVKILGVGTAGSLLADQLSREEFAGADFAFINTDSSAAPVSPSKQLLLDTKPVRGLGTGGDPERGRSLAEENFESLKALTAEADAVFLVTGLGGGAGSGVTPVLARAAREHGALVLAFVTLPFDCEGNRRQQQAQHSLEQLQRVCDGVICLANQKAFKLLAEHASFLETFRASAQLLMEGVRGVWRLLMHRGMIEIHFEELCALLRERHGESCFATVETAGTTRARDVIERIPAHPLLDGGHALETAVNLLVSIVGGPDLSMIEVDRVMQDINQRCPKARVVMGAAVDESFRDRLAVTIFATRAAKAEPAEADSGSAEADLDGGSGDFGAELLHPTVSTRPKTRMKPPAPVLTADQREEIISKHTGKSGRSRKHPGGPRLRQTTLPLDIVNKGRFDKSEPTIHKGEDLDLPTYVRRGVALN